MSIGATTDATGSIFNSGNNTLKLHQSVKELVSNTSSEKPFSSAMATQPISGFNLRSFRVDISQEAKDKAGAMGSNG
ncbi:MAG: hypothetical protein HQL93_12745 [Magnetococcales bacterium]|nr:hypothetical protein [Magnetococcales bacterium]